MKLLLHSIATLIGFGLLAAFALEKVADTFPEIDAIGWVVLGVLYVLTTLGAVQLDNWIEKRPWTWLNADKDRRMYLTIIVAGAVMALTIYLSWGWVGTYLAAHVGAPV